MSAMTDYLEDSILNHVFSSAALFTTPSTVYIALHTADPTDAGTTGELGTAASGYARVAVATNGTLWNDPVTSGTARLVDNSADITFAQATAVWGTISHVSIWGTSAGGDTSDVWLQGALTANKEVASGDTFKFAAGDLDITMS
jgi:hypothetical protein